MGNWPFAPSSFVNVGFGGGESASGSAPAEVFGLPQFNRRCAVPVPCRRDSSLLKLPWQRERQAPLGIRMINRCTLRFAESLCVGAIASIALLHSAFAATHEQIVERCRESARPQ